MEQFNNFVDKVEQHDGKFGHEQILVDKDEEHDAIDIADHTVDDQEEALEHTHQAYLGYALIFKADNG